MFFLPSSVNLYSTTYVGISTPFRTELLAPILDYTSLAVTTTYLLRLEGRRTGAGRKWRRRLQFLGAQPHVPNPFPPPRVRHVNLPVPGLDHGWIRVLARPVFQNHRGVPGRPV